MLVVEKRVHDIGHIVVVWAAFDDENREVGVGLCQSPCNYAGGGAT